MQAVRWCLVFPRVRLRHWGAYRWRAGCGGHCCGLGLEVTKKTLAESCTTAVCLYLAFLLRCQRNCLLAFLRVAWLESRHDRSTITKRPHQAPGSTPGRPQDWCGVVCCLAPERQSYPWSADAPADTREGACSPLCGYSQGAISQSLGASSSCLVAEMPWISLVESRRIGQVGSHPLLFCPPFFLCCAAVEFGISAALPGGGFLWVFQILSHFHKGAEQGSLVCSE